MEVKRYKPAYYDGDWQLHETKTKGTHVVSERGTTFQEHEANNVIHITAEERAEFTLVWETE